MTEASAMKFGPNGRGNELALKPKSLWPNQWEEDCRAQRQKSARSEGSWFKWLAKRWFATVNRECWAWLDIWPGGKTHSVFALVVNAKPLLDQLGPTTCLPSLIPKQLLSLALNQRQAPTHTHGLLVVVTLHPPWMGKRPRQKRQQTQQTRALLGGVASSARPHKHSSTGLGSSKSRGQTGSHYD